jgi:hypothetical protein
MEKGHNQTFALGCALICFNIYKERGTPLPPLTNFFAVILPSFSPSSLLNIVEIRSKI